MKDSVTPIDEPAAIFFQCRLQSIQLCDIIVRINCLICWEKLEKDYSVDIPPNRQHYLPGVKALFSGGLRGFISFSPRSFSHHIVVNNSFSSLVMRFLKWYLFIPDHEIIADVDAIQALGERVNTHTSSLLTNPSSFVTPGTVDTYFQILSAIVLTVT